ncbi:hypothetical protein LIER_40966 [Lithospermum erythrorhizon]|uniref:Uncharacterized protein n=1 Tax=Lithospermum erythrorhizon TaxID=34254 RepID=A0AAV3R282_LITER
MYLAKPFSIPNLDVTDDSPWGARKLHFHLMKPLLSKELVAPYSDLVDPYAAYAQTAKYFNQVESLKKNLTFKSNLNLELAKKCKDFEAELKGNSPIVEKLSTELTKEKGVAKARLVEKVRLEAERDSWRREKEAWLGEKAHLLAERDSSRGERETLQIFLDELERGKEEEIAQIKRDADLALASAVAKAESARINSANSTLRSFISSPAYEKKVGSECATYFHSVMASTIGRFPELAALFNEEVIRRPDWYQGMTLPIPEGAVLPEEGGETPNPLPEDNPL